MLNETNLFGVIEELFELNELPKKSADLLVSLLFEMFKFVRLAAFGGGATKKKKK